MPKIKTTTLPFEDHARITAALSAYAEIHAGQINDNTSLSDQVIAILAREHDNLTDLVDRLRTAAKLTLSFNILSEPTEAEVNAAREHIPALDDDMRDAEAEYEAGELAARREVETMPL